MKKQALIIAILAMSVMLFACINKVDYGILIEAESFETKGGWVVDPQFVEQMGSPYLLAHGLGRPVEEASTVFSCDKAGVYHVWVRTMDWAPGEWEPPGTFKVSVDGEFLENTLGTREGWGWQLAGSVRLEKSDVQVALHDLTGFEGRCDAIYFSIGETSPPEATEALGEFRKRYSPSPGGPTTVKEFDLVVVGGGIAGCAAAVAAAEEGLRVGLIHDRPILGGNASSEIRVHTEGITWHSERILSRLNTVHWPNGSPDAVKDDGKRHAFVEGYDSIDLFLEWRAFSVETAGRSITAVDAKHTSSGEMIRFKAPIFIDSTGDGWIGYWAGAEYFYGREASDAYGESWEEHGELWSPEEADKRVMGASVLWLTEDTGAPSPFPDVPWALDVAQDYAATSGTWHWEYISDGLHQIDDGEKIRDHMFRAVYGSFANAKKDPANAHLELEWMSYLLGKRESRRLVGDYVYSFEDVRELREFEDAVVKGIRPVDVHYRQKARDPSRPDFLSEALYYHVDYYYIPFRSLYSRDIDNLMMAGRCFSCTHVGLGGPRVMNTTGQMGVATGYAAALCKKHSVNPRGICTDHLDELKALIMGE